MFGRQQPHTCMYPRDSASPHAIHLPYRMLAKANERLTDGSHFSEHINIYHAHTECLSVDSQRTPDREAIGGLPGQANTVVSYVPAS